MLKTLEFSIDIKAEKEAIWNALWLDESYRKWINVFAEGSYSIAPNLNEGSKIMFLDPNKNGIFSNIEKHIPNSIIQFKHIGLVVAGKEQAVDDETRKWSGAKEEYALIDKDNSVTLNVKIDVMEEHLVFMQDKFPIALDLIKRNSI